MINRLKRLLFKFIRKMIDLIRIFDRQLYQKLFVKYLKYIGLNIVGNPTYISNDIFIDDIDYSLITIDEGVVISINVVILVHDYAVTRALIANEQRPKKELAIVRPVKIGKNCFVGAGSIILPGTEIGDNVIIGAGSVVKGKIPNNMVVAGNPLRTLTTIEEYLEKQLTFNKEFLKEDI
ncbi:acyltransferase [Bacillus sp. FJAT-27245]|uniref:acyltransferase n=1 Tax=Bacillus sp. FJAT-27245 TaxID=1684144 RepID=UPI0006A79C40|nr:acyltransferase [Bacillus sp. FJAT-27245]